MSEEFEWIDLQTYASEEEAEPLVSLIQENNITYNIIKDEHQSGDSLNLEFQNRGISTIHVQVLPRDLEHAKVILDIAAGKAVDDLQDDDYISQFADEDLLQILHTADEWSQSDVHLALKFLHQRGHQITEENIKVWAQERLVQLAEPSKPSATMLAAGYLFSIAGGLIGLLIGIQLAYFQKRLPDGNKVAMYAPEHRKQGIAMIAISILAMVLLLGYFVTR